MNGAAQNSTRILVVDDQQNIAGAGAASVQADDKEEDAAARYRNLSEPMETDQSHNLQEVVRGGGEVIPSPVSLMLTRPSRQ